MTVDFPGKSLVTQHLAQVEFMCSSEVKVRTGSITINTSESLRQAPLSQWVCKRIRIISLLK